MGLYRCVYESTHSSGVKGVNTFHVAAHTSGVLATDVDPGNVRDVLSAALDTKYRACLAPSWTVDAFVVSEVLTPGSTDVPASASETINLAGTMAMSGDSTPIPLSFLVTFYTDAAVRSGHGRMFLPGPYTAANLTSGGTWDPATQPWTLVKTFMDELLTTHAGGGLLAGFNLDLVVYSRTRHAAALSSYWFTVESYARRAAPHWLRSRATAP